MALRMSVEDAMRYVEFQTESSRLRVFEHSDNAYSMPGTKKAAGSPVTSLLGTKEAAVFPCHSQGHCVETRAYMSSSAHKVTHGGRLRNLIGDKHCRR